MVILEYAIIRHANYLSTQAYTASHVLLTSMVSCTYWSTSEPGLPLGSVGSLFLQLSQPALLPHLGHSGEGIAKARFYPSLQLFRHLEAGLGMPYVTSVSQRRSRKILHCGRKKNCRPSEVLSHMQIIYFI